MDPQARRLKYRRGLHDLYLPLYDSLCGDLSLDWAPFYGVRTIIEQDILYSIGRTTSNSQKTVTDAKGGESPHNWGCASDWVKWSNGQPLWANAGDPIWNEYRDAVIKSGGRWGGGFPKPDCPHNELPLDVLWRDVKPVYDQGGYDAVNAFVHAHRVTIM